MKELVNGLIQNKEVKVDKLYFDGTGCGAVSLSKILSTEPNRFVGLNLDCNAIGGSGAERLVAVVQESPSIFSLEALGLRNVQIGDAGATSIGRALKYLASCET